MNTLPTRRLKHAGGTFPSAGVTYSSGCRGQRDLMTKLLELVDQSSGVAPSKPVCAEIVVRLVAG